MVVLGLRTAIKAHAKRYCHSPSRLPLLLCAGSTSRLGNGFLFMDKRVTDKTGKTFGTLKAIRLLPKDKADGNNRKWECFCTACGRLTAVKSSNLRKRGRLSCGCMRDEWIRTSSITHGCTKTRTFHSWYSAKRRCKVNPNYYNRGITMCDRWAKSFQNFLDDMGHCQDGHSLDRIDNNKGYEPINCRWADRVTQANNTRNVKLYEFNGKKLSLAQWSREVGISACSLRARMQMLGWSLEKSLTTALQRQ